MSEDIGRWLDGEVWSWSERLNENGRILCDWWELSSASRASSPLYYYIFLLTNFPIIIIIVIFFFSLKMIFVCHISSHTHHRPVIQNLFTEVMFLKNERIELQIYLCSRPVCWLGIVCYPFRCNAATS